MPTHAETQLAIETRFSTNWADQSVATRFENEARKRPVNSFIRLSIRNGRSNLVGIAGNKHLYRRPGIIFMQCFVPVKEGTQPARVMADAAVLIFEGQQFSSIICRESEIVEVGDDGKGFWQVNAKVFFDFDFEVTIT